MKKISFKAIGFIVSLLCVIGGVSAAYQQQVLHRLSPRNSETVTTENGQSARLSNFKLNQEDFGEYSVLSATSNSVSSSSYAEVGSESSAAGETPALIYGYAQMGDYCPEGAPCMISFQSDGGNGAFVAVLDENLFWIDSAVFADGKYYICQSVMGNWGYLFDTATWQPITKNMSIDADCVSKSLAWDSKNNVVYGCLNSKTKNKYDLATFDITTQKRVKTIASNTKLYAEMACDGDGNLYGFVKETVSGKSVLVLYKIDTESGEATKIGSTGVTALTFTSAFYDTKNKHMYLSSGSSDCPIYSVNLDTAESTLVRKTPGGSPVRGCYVAEVAVADDAPNMVTDLEPVFEGGSLSGKLNFTLPVRTYNGSTSDAPLGYKVSINGKEFSNIAPSADLKWGDSISTPVEVKELGKYTFSVAAQIPGNVGASENVSKWVGNDYPSAPKKVSLIYEEPNLYLSWDSVKTSKNDGYVNIDKITYKVFDNTGKAMTDFISETNWSTKVDKLEDGTKYDVVAYHEGLASNASSSNTMGILRPPFREQFSQGGNHLDWFVVDGNNDKYTWWFDDSRETGGAYIRTNKNTPKDDYLITPPLYLEAGKYYNLFITADSDAQTEQFEVLMGTAPTATALTTKLLDTVSFRSTATSKDFQCSVKADQSGVYYIAIHATTPPAAWGNLYIYDFDLSEPLSEDAPGYGSMTITDDPDRKLLATLKINGPDKSVGGSALKGITKYEVYRDEKLVKTIDNPGVGATVNYTDEVPFCGDYKYAVVSYNENGKGRELRDWIYVGVGKPDAIKSISVLEQPGDDGILDVTWTTPTMDVNGRSLPTDSIFYDVVMDGKWRITKGSIPNASVTVKLNAEDYKPQQFKYFYVEPYTSAGTNKDGRKYSEMVPVGAPYALPFIESVPKGGVQHNWALSGAYNKWQPYNSVGTPQCYPQDNDGGLWGWIPAGEGDNALLMTGKMLIAGENPTASFYYRAISDSKNEIHLVYREIGETEWKTLHKLTLNETGKDEWVREFVSLSAINGKKVQLGFGGVAEDTRYLICIDNIYIGEIVNYDAAVADSDAPSKTKPGEPVAVRAVVENKGFNDLDDVVISLIRDGKTVAKIENYLLPVGARNEVELVDNTVDLFAETSMNYYIQIQSSKDQVATNNVTPTYRVDLILPKTPVINDLVAEEKSAGVTLTWTKPNIATGNPDNIVTEDFEDYKTWDVDRAGDWTFYDVDKRSTVGISGISIPNLYKPMAYMVFENSKLNYTYKSHIDGHKYLASFCSSADKDGVIANDNWLVSPKLSGVAQNVSFWAKTYNDYYGEEEFEFLYSTTDDKIESFKKLGGASVPMNEALGENGQPWTEYSYSLPQGTRYFAIRHVSKDGFIFMLDDITYNAGGGDIKLLGYNVYRDGEKINQTLVADPAYVDATAEKGTHKYYVTSVYDLGESGLSNVASVQTSSVDEISGGFEIHTGKLSIIVNGADGSRVIVTAADGKVIENTIANSSLSVGVPAVGVYVVMVDNKPYKVIVR